MQILSVCTGNICRSPLAEYLLRKRLDPQIFTVTSGGVKAVRSGRVPRQQLRIGLSLEIPELMGHSGQQLKAADVQAADLVLVATRDHRGKVLEFDPTANTKIFTLREFGHLAQTVRQEDVEELLAQGYDRPAAVVAAVAQQRGQGDPVPDYDIVDPYGHDEAAYALSAQQLVPAVEQAATYLAECFGDVVSGGGE